MRGRVDYAFTPPTTFEQKTKLFIFIFTKFLDYGKSYFDRRAKIIN